MPSFSQTGDVVGVSCERVRTKTTHTHSGEPLILERLPATLLLVLTAQIAALIIGVVLGVISARKPKGISNYVVTFLALFGYSAPVFWTGILLLITFSLTSIGSRSLACVT